MQVSSVLASDQKHTLTAAPVVVLCWCSGVCVCLELIHYYEVDALNQGINGGAHNGPSYHSRKYCIKLQLGTRRFDGLKVAIKQVPKTKVKRWGRVQERMVPIEFELLDKVSDGHNGIVQMIDWYERRSR